MDRKLWAIRRPKAKLYGVVEEIIRSRNCTRTVARFATVSEFKLLVLIYFVCSCIRRDSSVGIEMSYKLDGRGTGVGSPAGVRYSSLFHNVQTGSGAHPASYPTSTGDLFPGVKRLGREADHSSNAEIKNEWSYTFTSLYVFMVWCLIN
jgi:hypothetical protein